MTEEAAQRTVRIEACLFLLAPEGFLAIGMGLLDPQGTSPQR